jgi:hypothetical protein
LTTVNRVRTVVREGYESVRLTKPQIIAEKASVEITRPREGASAESTPIWIPREPIMRTALEF